MYNFQGKMTGQLQYRPNGQKKVQNNEKYGKYYTHVSKNEISVFGLESLDFSRTIYLVGGLFKAATLHRLGYTAFHVSSVGYGNLLPQLRALSRPFKAIGDNDSEGAQFARRFCGWTSPLDVDEMSDDAVHEMIYKNSPCPSNVVKKFVRMSAQAKTLLNS
jgi:hypothetical protein